MNKKEIEKKFPDYAKREIISKLGVEYLNKQIADYVKTYNGFSTYEREKFNAILKFQGISETDIFLTYGSYTNICGIYGAYYGVNEVIKVLMDYHNYYVNKPELMAVIFEDECEPETGDITDFLNENNCTNLGDYVNKCGYYTRLENGGYIEMVEC